MSTNYLLRRPIAQEKTLKTNNFLHIIQIPCSKCSKEIYMDNFNFKLTLQIFSQSNRNRSLITSIS